jgi:hypothetical protein
MMRVVILGWGLIAMAGALQRTATADVRAADFGKTADGASVQVYHVTNPGKSASLVAAPR